MGPSETRGGFGKSTNTPPENSRKLLVCLVMFLLSLPVLLFLAFMVFIFLAVFRVVNF